MNPCEHHALEKFRIWAAKSGVEILVIHLLLTIDEMIWKEETFLRGLPLANSVGANG